VLVVRSSLRTGQGTSCGTEPPCTQTIRH
jgi:hypothetical protein